MLKKHKFTCDGANPHTSITCYGHYDQRDKVQYVHGGLDCCYINADGTVSYTKSMFAYLLDNYGHRPPASHLITEFALDYMDGNEIVDSKLNHGFIYDVSLIRRGYCDQTTEVKRDVMYNIVKRCQKYGVPQLDYGYSLKAFRDSNTSFYGYTNNWYKLKPYEDCKHVFYNKDGSISQTKSLVLDAIIPCLPAVYSGQWNWSYSLLIINLIEGMLHFKDNEIANEEKEIELIKDIIFSYALIEGHYLTSDDHKRLSDELPAMIMAFHEKQAA